MVMIGDPFVGNVEKKLSAEELVQALRVDIAGELEAILVYNAHASATDDQRAKAVLYSIRDEERQHVGELLHLMEILDPQEAQLLSKGRQEVDQLLNQRGQQAGQGQPQMHGQQYTQQQGQGQQHFQGHQNMPNYLNQQGQREMGYTGVNYDEPTRSSSIITGKEHI